MRRSRHNKTTSAAKLKDSTASSPVDPLRAGMPAQDSITGVEEFRKGKKVFRIIHTSEVDAYETAPSKAKRKKR
jgi:hypothetical protein